MAPGLKRARARRNTKDGRGTVRVQVYLVDVKERKHVKGNIVRSFTFRPAKVSEVAALVASIG